MLNPGQMKWHQLTEHSNEQLWRGTVLRLLVSKWPYETPVDFMLVDLFSPKGLALIVSSGYKAGLVLVQLPASSRHSENACSVSNAWLIKHWIDWVYPDCPVEKVLFSEYYVPGVSSNDNA
jgi:hypothetical protein